VKLTGIGEPAEAAAVQMTNGQTARFSRNELANMADWQLMELAASGSPQAPVELDRRDAARAELWSPRETKEETEGPPPTLDVFV
jgi:hypothetical protein